MLDHNRKCVTICLYFNNILENIQFFQTSEPFKRFYFFFKQTGLWYFSLIGKCLIFATNSIYFRNFIFKLFIVITTVNWENLAGKMRFHFRVPIVSKRAINKIAFYLFVYPIQFDYFQHFFFPFFSSPSNFVPRVADGMKTTL